MRVPAGFAARFVPGPACLLLALMAAACGPAQLVTASAPQARPLQFVGEWGMQGRDPGELADPAGLAVDLNNRVYLVDRRSGLLQKFEPDGVPSLAYVDPTVRGASALAVDSGGAIYVADAPHGRIWIHFPDGDPLRNFRITAQRDFDGVFGFSINGDGEIFVPDPHRGRIQAFSARGKLQRAWKLPAGPDGHPARPVAVAAGLDDFVYIADAGSGRIAKYTARGAQVAWWDRPEDADGPLYGIAVSRSHVFVLRGTEPRLEAWTFDGQRVLTDTFGDRLDHVPPASLYFAVSRDEQIFVLDSAQPRVLHFRVNLPGR